MKISNGSPRRRSKRTDAAQRAQLLALFDRSELSSTAFARQQGLNYTTFCGWRQRRAKTKPSPSFVQVELQTTAAAAELMIELSTRARIRINSASQLELAARLLHTLDATAPC